jgi:stage III sporulation protein AA
MQMKCAWKELLTLLPPRLRDEVDMLGRETGQNVRLRLAQPPELNCAGGSHWLTGAVTGEELQFVLNTASRFSPWAAETLAKGYLTAQGGHRLGVCGEAIVKEGRTTGFRQISSICIRIARDFPGISRKIHEMTGSFLIVGAPGWGKTTLLRDLIRSKSNAGAHVSVADQRQEIFPMDMERGCRTEVLTGCSSAAALDMLTRTMEPEYIALDEITAEEDCIAISRAARCGVKLLATAHAANLDEVRRRPVYADLLREGIFDHYIILQPDKSWHLERSSGWITNGSVRY